MEEVGRITRAAGVVSFFTILSRVLGLLRDIVVAYLFGAQATAEAFVVAFRLPNLLRRLTAEGALTVGFIPVFTDYLTNKSKDEAMRVARIIFTFASVFLAGLTVLGIIFAAPILRVYAVGFLAHPEKFDLTVFLSRLMFPYIFFVSLVALAMGVLNSFRHFMAPALAPVLLNLSIIACALLLSPALDEPVAGLAYGVLLGGIAQLLLQIPFLRRYGFSFGIDFHFRHPALKRLLLLMGPAVFGAAVYQINVFVSTVLASTLPGGSVPYLYYADRLLEFPVGVFAIALGTAVLPSYSSLVAKRETAELRGTLSYALRLVNFVSLPAALGLTVVAVPVFSLFFQRGAFDAETTLNTAQALFYYSLGLWGISGIKVAVPVFYAMKDTRTPVWIALWSFMLNLLLSLVLMGPVHVSSDVSLLGSMIAALSQHLAIFSLAHGGLALATSISSTFNFLALIVILHRRLGGFPWSKFFSSFVRNLFNALLMALPLLWIVGRVNWIGPERNLLMNGMIFVTILGLGIFLYAFLAFLLRSPEWEIVRSIGGKIRRRAF